MKMPNWFWRMLGESAEEQKPPPSRDAVDKLFADIEKQFVDSGVREREKTVFDRFPVGAEFQYLGMQMRVVRHERAGACPSLGFVPGMSWPSALVCEYRGAEELHEKRFIGAHFTAIAKGFQP